MFNVKKRSRVISVFTAGFLLSLAIAGGASADTAVKEPGALTSPPPLEMSIMSVNPNYKYLSNAQSTFQKTAATQARLSASTFAYSNVDSIGATFILQRWTGTVWVDSVVVTDQSTHSSSFSGSQTFSTISGYYYRGKTIHWAKEGAVREETVLYTENFLAG